MPEALLGASRAPLGQGLRHGRSPPHPTTPDATLGALARRQHGVASRSQAKAAGLTDRQIRHRLSTGTWSEVRPRVYATTGGIAGWEVAVMAVVLAVPGAVASYRTALRLAGVRANDDEVIEVTTAAGYHRVLDGVVIHQTRDLPAGDRTAHHRVPTTTVERALVDLAGVLPPADLLGILDDAVSARAARRETVYARAKAMRAGRGPHTVLIDATRPGAAAAFHSWLERHTSEVFAAAALPPPRWNVPLSDGRGRIGIIDAVFPPDDVVTAELDGLRFHRTPAQRRADNERDRRLVLSGRIPLRFTYDDVLNRPHAVVADVRAALDAAARRRDAALP